MEFGLHNLIEIQKNIENRKENVKKNDKNQQVFGNDERNSENDGFFA